MFKCVNTGVKHININRTVCDIKDFLGMWTESEFSSPKKGRVKTEKTYNPITANCQQFCADLFEYLVGHKKEYKQKVQAVKAKVQSPYDLKKYGVSANQKTKSQPKPQRRLGHGVGGIGDEIKDLVDFVIDCDNEQKLEHIALPLKGDNGYGSTLDSKGTNGSNGDHGSNESRDDSGDNEQKDGKLRIFDFGFHAKDTGEAL